MGKDYRIEYLPSAISDLQRILDYISGDLSSPLAAATLLDKIDQAVGRLSQYPLSCKKVKDTILNGKGYRVLIVENYLIFYVVVGDIVEVRRVLYRKRNYENLLK